ncbi:hypothetical protein NM688_g7723 [Phlebia brevispora]|uniref:Uncharacterized protein n=1 Tax=Phlebia brevispora TaxID=194682 RepID=A0ACC1S213_9APHY|nr:hypothetical protein NM688_g7723 [Phlebia brevispora]
MDSPTSTKRKLVGQPLLYAISVFASLGVFLFGYDQGVMSGVITGPHFLKFFNNPTALEVGTMVAVLEIGAFITSVAAGRIGDTLGRRGTLFIGAVVFSLGGAVQTVTPGFWIMVVGRIIAGFGVGLLSTIVPIFQSEISPPDHRGALACMEFTGNVFGYACSVWIGYFCSFLNSDLAWRVPLSVQCMIGALLAAGSLVMPESPRWLIDNDKDEEGMRVLADLHGGDLEDLVARAEFQEIKERVLLERENGEGRSYAMMWRKYKRRVLLAMSSQAFAQLNGINGKVVFYVVDARLDFIFRSGFVADHISCLTARVFEEAGWIGRDAILMTGINAVIYVLSTLPPWYLVDRWGRRIILLTGAVVMGIALAFTGWWMYIDVPQTPRAVVVCVIIFNAAFGYSWGPLPWLYPPEIMPLTVRAKGVSLSTATNWAFNFLRNWKHAWKMRNPKGLHWYRASRASPELPCLENRTAGSSVVSSAGPTIAHPTSPSTTVANRNCRGWSMEGWMLPRTSGVQVPVDLTTLNANRKTLPNALVCLSDVRGSASDLGTLHFLLVSSSHDSLLLSSARFNGGLLSTRTVVALGVFPCTFYCTVTVEYRFITMHADIIYGEHKLMFPVPTESVDQICAAPHASAATMSLLPTTALLWRRCPTLTRFSISCRRISSHGKQVASPDSFEQLGLNRAVVMALQEAFPNVKQPTRMQAEFLPLVISGKDVLLKDRTGTGKSFALLLALLNRPRRYIPRKDASGKYVKQPITSCLFIAPHRDLVHQFLYWIQCMYNSTLHTFAFDSIAQTILRNNTSSIEEQAKRIRANPPHILLGTPQAILDAMDLENDPISLKNLSTIVVDEADYLIEHTPKQVTKEALQKFTRDIHRHPSPTRQILDRIYSPWIKLLRSQEDARKLPPMRRAQLVMASATLKSSFRAYVQSRASGWLYLAGEKASTVTPATEELKKINEADVAAVFGGSSLLHSALVVSNDGDISNIPGAISVPDDADASEEVATEQLETQSTAAEEEPSTGSLSPPANSNEGANEFADTPSPFNPASLEAVAATFAVRVPQLALLVLPASSPVRRAVTELRSLGVNAHALDVMQDESGGLFLLKKEAAAVDNPTLLVSTLATTRGLDLPNLTHVFILGMPRELTTEEYLHMAGRVGRFGRAGHVVCVVEAACQAPGKNGKMVVHDEGKRLGRIYSRLGVTPVKIEEFEAD